MFYILLFILLITIVFLFPKHKSNIKFLSKEDLVNIYQSDEFKQYYKLFQPKEIFFRTNKKVTDKNNLIKAYLNNVITIPDNYKKMLTNMIEKSDELIYSFLQTDFEWKIVCYNDDFEWGYPYTIDGAIFICIDDLEYWSRKDEKYGISFLVHEAFHILQKGKLKDYFENLYANWGFVKKDIKDKLMEIPEIKENWVTNPDGLNGEWILKTNNGYICSILLLNENGSHITKYVKLDKELNIDKKIYDKMDEYDNIDKLVRQKYHPNEIIGSYIENYIFQK